MDDVWIHINYTHFSVMNTEEKREQFDYYFKQIVG